MYKDKDKQREANRQASQRRRDKGMMQGMTKEGMTPQGITVELVSVENGNETVIAKGLPERTAQGNIRVSKPSDDDYEPQCETTKLIGHDVLNPITKMCAAIPDGTSDISSVKALHQAIQQE